MLEAQARFLRNVAHERKQQDAKWGQNIVDVDRMIVVLLEEVGEVARAQLEDDRSNLCVELTQVAAVCSKLFEMLEATAHE